MSAVLSRIFILFMNYTGCSKSLGHISILYYIEMCPRLFEHPVYRVILTTQKYLYTSFSFGTWLSTCIVNVALLILLLRTGILLNLY